MIADTRSTAAIVNALTIDVEDYFQVSAFAPYIQRSAWESMPCRVEQNIDRILALLSDTNVKATFFTLGWIAERYPELVRRVAQSGHELASHGFSHQRATDQGRDEFLADIRLAKAILEDISGHAVNGYRAPSFSVGPSNPWASECIGEAGYRYSSSVYPIRHDHYGVPDAPRFAHESSAGVLELPVATVRMFRANWPAGGGGYFRLLPYTISRWSIRHINNVDGKPAMFYFHPWELDPDQPRVQGPGAKSRFRHYLNLKRTEPRMRRLLADFCWDRVDRVFLGGTA
jgi:polysaccharide deacetylase family protein (PEP-CTERM system associated)